MGNMESIGQAKSNTLLKPFWHLLRPVIVVVLAAVILLILWQRGSDRGDISTLLYPAPSAIFEKLKEWQTEGEIWDRIQPTLERLYTGFVLGSLVGVTTGLLLGWMRLLYQVFDPIISFLYPIPKIAILPIFFLLLGFNESTRVFVIATTAFFPMVVSTITGVHQINANYLAVARVYKVGLLRTVFQVVLPSCVPFILNGLRIAFNTTFVVTITIEIVASPDGLGRLLWEGWQIYRIEEVYATLFLIGVLSIFNNLILNSISALLLRWQ